MGDNFEVCIEKTKSEISEYTDNCSVYESGFWKSILFHYYICNFYVKTPISYTKLLKNPVDMDKKKLYSEKFKRVYCELWRYYYDGGGRRIPLLDFLSQSIIPIEGGNERGKYPASQFEYRVYSSDVFIKTINRWENIPQIYGLDHHTFQGYRFKNLREYYDIYMSQVDPSDSEDSIEKFATYIITEELFDFELLASIVSSFKETDWLSKFDKYSRGKIIYIFSELALLPSPLRHIMFDQYYKHFNFTSEQEVDLLKLRAALHHLLQTFFLATKLLHANIPESQFGLDVKSSLEVRIEQFLSDELEKSRRLFSRTNVRINKVSAKDEPLFRTILTHIACKHIPSPIYEIQKTYNENMDALSQYLKLLAETEEPLFLKIPFDL